MFLLGAQFSVRDSAILFIVIGAIAVMSLLGFLFAQLTVVQIHLKTANS